MALKLERKHLDVLTFHYGQMTEKLGLSHRETARRKMTTQKLFIIRACLINKRMIISNTIHFGSDVLSQNSMINQQYLILILEYMYVG